MAYGGIFKTIVRVVATTVGGIACGPPCAAIGSAVATAATGGSFQEALMSGATAYIGASITQGINTSIGDAAAAGRAGIGTAGTEFAGGAAGEFGGLGVSSLSDAGLEAFGGAGAALPGSTAQGLFTALPANSFVDPGGLGGPMVGAGDVVSATGQVDQFGLPIPGTLGPPEADLFAASGSPIQTGAASIAPTPDPSLFTQASQYLTDPNAGLNPLITDANAAINAGISKFPGTAFGKVGDVTRSSFDFFKDMGNKVLGPGGLNLDLTPLQIANTGDLIGAGIGGLTTLTLDQALAMDLPGLDETLGQAFGPEQIAALRQEQRNAMSQQVFNRLTGSTENPFGTTPEGLEEFNKVIAGGIERENVGLGPDITEQQFSAVFDQPDLGTNILGEEQRLRQQAFNQEIGQAFPEDAFQSLDDEIISSIVDERRGPAQGQISSQLARGNINTLGGQAANVFLSGQEPGIRERITEVGEGVLGGNRQAISDIQGRAAQSVADYSLGDPLFDVAPFSQERSDVISEREGTLGADVRGAIGGESLFDVRGALSEGGSGQLVSGAAQPFLDTLAARELDASRNKRGLGAKGSGVF
jgi:hypothetical protein